MHHTAGQEACLVHAQGVWKQVCTTGVPARHGRGGETAHNKLQQAYMWQCTTPTHAIGGHRGWGREGARAKHPPHATLTLQKPASQLCTQYLRLGCPATLTKATSVMPGYQMQGTWDMSRHVPASQDLQQC